MTAIAASPPRDITINKPRGRLGFLHSPTVATALLGAIVTAFGWFVGPMVARMVQDREKTLEVRTALATDEQVLHDRSRRRPAGGERPDLRADG